MENRETLKPDLAFVREMRNAGGDSLKHCYQCATCSTVCNLSPAAHPFPRKEMIWAQWGLKNRLLGDPDVWLCHQCNDCSTYCPRGAKPGDVLAAVRKYTIKEFSTPGFLGKMVNTSSLWPILFLIPVLLLLGVLTLGNHLYFPTGEVIYAKFLPHGTLNVFFITASSFAILMMLVSLSRFWQAMNRTALDRTHQENRSGFFPALIATIIEIITHKKFADCKENETRRWAHFIVFYGFILLAITAGLGAAAEIGWEKHPPFGLTHPFKIIGNTGALLFFVGMNILLFRRIGGHEKSGNSTYPDWLFLISLYVIGLTGILLEVFRISGVAPLAYSTFFVHLVFIFVLLVYLPYSKFAHFAYRFVAILWAKTNGRGEPGALQTSQVVSYAQSQETVAQE